VTLRGDPSSDYEGIYQHFTLSAEDNRSGLAMLLAEEILIGSGLARFAMRGLARWGRLKPSELLMRFEEFVASRASELAQELQKAFTSIREASYFIRAMRGEVRTAIYEERERSLGLLMEFMSGLPINEAAGKVCAELAKLDCLILPRADLEGTGEVETVYVAPFNVPAVASLLIGETAYELSSIEWNPISVHLRHRAGYRRYAGEAIDLSGTWLGRVTECECLVPVPQANAGAHKGVRRESSMPTA
jgi:hypothetical protein